MPQLPFKVGEYADEIVDADGRVVLQLAGGIWLEQAKVVFLRPDEVALRDFVIEACNSTSSGAAVSPTTAVVSESRVRATADKSVEYPPQIHYSGTTITDLEAMVDQAVTK